MRNHREIQFVVLSNVVELARQTPDLFRKYIKDFYISVRGVACGGLAGSQRRARRVARGTRAGRSGVW